MDMKDILVKLEFDKVLAMLVDETTSAMGREKAEKTMPAYDLELVAARLQATSEAVDILRLYPNFSLGDIRDIRRPLKKAEVGVSLEPGELLDVHGTLKVSARIKGFFERLDRSFPILKEQARRLSRCPDLVGAIEQAIDDDGTVSDHASPQLAQVRRQIGNMQERIKSKLNNILRSADQQKMLQDTLITVRGGRYVLPVKQEYRSKFPGLVHDQSASGATLFIEPMGVVEMNNRLKELHLAEKREIERILAAISQQVAQELESLNETVQGLAELDYLFAKARLSHKLKGVEPKLNKDGRIMIINGRHPLITGQVVPISLRLGYDFNTLVITGPNTGGKTVTLKTIGLLTLMAQAGLHVPADPETELSVFRGIFADIGDEQSIEQSLSTFSAHMTNIIKIVQEADADCLVLLDELGAGTDPSEGASLAMAILGFLHGRGVKTVATTHYGQLKTYAYSAPGIENASVEFDKETLRPTYRLLMGLPGRSNAFEIALRLGLPGEIIEQARKLVGSQETKVDDLIQGLEESRLRTETERSEAQRLRLELERAKEQLDKEKENLARQKSEILEEARLEARRLIRYAKREIQELTKDLRTNIALEAQRAQSKAVQEARQRVKSLEEKIDKVIGQQDHYYAGEIPAKVSVGDLVYIPKLNQKGTVLSPPNNQNEVQVQAGIIKINVELNELRLPTEQERAAEQRSIVTHLVTEKGKTVSPELDLRGLKVEEALQKVDKYLDDAQIAGLEQVTLIHGKGTGALRQAVQDYLRQHRLAKSFRLGSQAEGGSGVTIVEIR